MSLADVGIDDVFGGGVLLFARWNEGPVGGVFPAFLDPAGEDFFFVFGERFAFVLRGHGVFFVVDAVDEFAFCEVVGVDGEDSFSIFGGFGVAIEAQVFLFFGVRAVAGKAFVRKDGENFAGEIQWLFRVEKSGGKGGDDYENVKKGKAH